MAKPALGRGLGALLGGASVVAKPSPPPANIEMLGQVQRVGLDRIRPCPFRPRRDFSPETIRELADSIKEQGIVQPLIVRDVGEQLELIAGERRWRAAQLLGLAEVPVIVRTADDRAVLELALIENLQRENLNAVEEALGYSQLVEHFQLRQEDVAVKVGKSRTVVANALRLLKLPANIQKDIREQRISVGHAKVILGLATERQQKIAAERVIKEALNVRQTEELVARLQAREAAPDGRNSVTIPPTRDSHLTDLESRLRERFGTKVHLRYRQGKGAMEISFFNDDDLERILQIIGVQTD